MSSELELKPHPACRAPHPSQCSNCTLAFDCSRSHKQRNFSWALVALAMLSVLALFAQQ